MPDIPGQPPQPSPQGAPPGAAPAVGGPSGSPMMTPQKAAGAMAQGKARVMIAMHALKLSMLDLGTGPEFNAVLEAITKLTKQFGKSEEDSKQLMPAEVMQAMQPAAGPGAPPGGAPQKPPGPPQGAAPPM